jgi:hypothetical protein
MSGRTPAGLARYLTNVPTKDQKKQRGGRVHKIQPSSFQQAIICHAEKSQATSSNSGGTTASGNVRYHAL